MAKVLCSSSSQEKAEPDDASSRVAQQNLKSYSSSMRSTSSSESLRSSIIALPTLLYSDSAALHQLQQGQPAEQFIREVLRKRHSGLRAEFNAIPAQRGAFTVCNEPKNACKNRYVNVPCLDGSRVALRDGRSGEYIHANYVDGYKQTKAFVCTQGPLRSSVVDFWRMIWQENSLLIIMTSQLQESGREKCVAYWPTAEGKTVEYGNQLFRVSCHRRRDKGEMGYIRSDLTMTHLERKESRQLCHVQFTSWFDFGVPEHPERFLDCVNEMRKLQLQLVRAECGGWTGHPLGPPIVIHCSAGIGRTGTYVALDVSARRLLESDRVDLFETVRRIRTQRFGSVQTADQYVFLHLAIVQLIYTQKGVTAEGIAQFDKFWDV